MMQIHIHFHGDSVATALSALIGLVADIEKVQEPGGEPVGGTPASATAEQPTAPTPVDVHPSGIRAGDRVRYVRQDGSFFVGTVVSVAGDYDAGDLVVRIQKDDNGRVTAISSIGADMRGHFTAA